MDIGGRSSQIVEPPGFNTALRGTTRSGSSKEPLLLRLERVGFLDVIAENRAMPVERAKSRRVSIPFMTHSRRKAGTAGFGA
jgi:hypothetical protein